MNPVLAQLYGTGFDKTASEYIDPSQISGADMLALMEAEEMNKVAYDDGVDLSHLSGRELLELYAEAEEAEAYDNQGYALEKMAQDGSLEYWDMVGRIQAHAYADEMDKLASYGDYDDDYHVIDIDDIDGETMLALLDEGWELDKTAGVISSIKGMASRAANTSMRDIYRGARGFMGRRATSVATATPASLYSRGKRTAARGLDLATARSLRAMMPGGGIKANANFLQRAVRGLEGPKAASEARKVMALYGGSATAAAAGVTAAAAGTAALGTGAALGTAYYMKKNKMGPFKKGGRFNR